MKKLISKKDFEAYVNIYSIGEQFYPVTVIPPENVKIIDYSPQNVEIRFIKKIKRHQKWENYLVQTGLEAKLMNIL